MRSAYFPSSLTSFHFLAIMPNLSGVVWESIHLLVGILVYWYILVHTLESEAKKNALTSCDQLEKVALYKS